MPIADSDIKIKFSVKTGSAGNSQTSDGDNSLGKYISTSEVTDATLHELFDQISGDENAASESEYRCVFVHNAHGSLTLQDAKVWISAETAGGANVEIGIDTTAASAIGASPAQALEVADEDTAPVGVSFSSPTTKATGLSLGSIAAGQCRAVWIKRAAQNSAAINNDGFTLSVEGDTAA